jgi:VWFA-related protein
MAKGLKVFLCALLLSLLVFAKDKENKSEVTFTSRAELVLVPVLVTDKQGNHINGLKKEDFTVLENGSEQKVVTFDEITSDTQRVSRARNPNLYSNLVVGSPSASRITLIVLDLINTPFTSQADARSGLLKYLTQSLDQREPTALYTLNRTGIHVIHDFTTDSRVLVAALHKVKGDASHMVTTPEEMETMTGSASPDGSAGVDPAAVQDEAAKLQMMMEDAELNFQSYQQRLAITYTLEGMQQVAHALAGFVGRKSLIWASGGFPFSVSDTTMQLAPAGRDSLTDVLPLYERTWQLLNDAQIALYPIDVKGLQVTAVASSSIRNPGVNYSRNMAWRQMDTQSVFQTFASMTGGRAYYNSNDLVKGFRDAVHDSSEYYMLGYYLDRSKTRAGWRRLAVKVHHDHVDVRARSGFFVTHTTTDPAKSRNSDLVLAFASSLDYTALGMTAQFGKTEPGKEAGKRRINYAMHLAADRRLVDETDNNHIALEFMAMAKTPEGKAINHPEGQIIDAHVGADKLPMIQNKGVAYSGALELAPGEYTVRFVIRDDLSGRIGSVSAPLKVE